MTRLRFDEREVLDTLIDVGMARSRSEALACCVRIVADKHSEWIDEVREAAGKMAELRDRGPTS